MQQSPMSVGIVGGGVVGTALFHAYSLPSQNITTMLHDIDPARSKHSLLEVLEADVVLLCLPTPSLKDNIGLDVSALEEFCKAHAGWRKPFVIKSTVPVGTTRRLAKTYELGNLYHSPEFLTERTAEDDARNPKGLLLGTPYNGDLFHPGIVELFKRLAIRLGRIGTSEETEMVKIVLNAFYGVKVSFFNEVYQLCQKLGISYNDVSRMSEASGMIYPQHMQVPGPDGLFGFGGKCLPKDLAQFIRHCLDNKVEPVMSFGASCRCAVDRQRPVQEKCHHCNGTGETHLLGMKDTPTGKCLHCIGGKLNISPKESPAAVAENPGQPANAG